MKITYDPEVAALYIRLIDKPTEVTTQRLSGEIAVNYAPNGRIVGIEVLDAAEYVLRLGEEPTVAIRHSTAVSA